MHTALLDELRELGRDPGPERVVTTGALQAGEIQVMWSTRGLEIARPAEPPQHYDPSRAVTVQLSWSMTTGAPRSFLDRMRLRPPRRHALLHVELRLPDQRVRLMAQLPDDQRARLEGLPRLQTSTAEVVPLEELLALLRTVICLGGRLAEATHADTDDDPATALAPRPRPVTGLQRFLLLWYGGQTAGWVALVLSLAITVPFAACTEAVHLFDWVGAERHQARAIVTTTAATNFAQNDQKVHEVCYSFETAAGEPRQGCSYVDGSPPTPGSLVDIEYREDLPTVSVIQGMRQERFSALIGLIMLGVMALILAGSLFGVSKAMTRRDLLVWGHLARASVVHHKLVAHTSRNHKKKPLYTSTLAFSTPDGREHTFTRYGLEEDLQTPESHLALYAPDHPGSFAPLASLPASVGPDGEIRVTVRWWRFLIALAGLSVVAAFAWMLLPG